jgi:hypothetical protein
MAISIAYGIGFATILTLLMLPLLLTFNNRVKVGAKWLRTGEEISKEEVERAIKEQLEEEHLLRHIPASTGNSASKEGSVKQESNVIEEHAS